MKFTILRLLTHYELGMFHEYRRQGKERAKQRSINFENWDVVDTVFPSAEDRDTIAINCQRLEDEHTVVEVSSWLKRQHKNWRFEGDCPTTPFYGFVDPGVLFAMVVDASTTPAKASWVVIPAEHPAHSSILGHGENILIFLPGEREIKETSETLRKHRFNHFSDPGKLEILSLYARLAYAEQQRVFHKSNVVSRIILATNVAETSLTVPGIRYDIDTGVARINRYNHRNKIEQLLVEKISQASANQRAGRCGRVMSGICIRLYAKEELETRPLYTDPEILRTSLASVILRMKSLKIGNIENFPFIQRPLPRMIADGYQSLSELGALDIHQKLTPIG